MIITTLKFSIHRYKYRLPKCNNNLIKKLLSKGDKLLKLYIVKKSLSDNMWKTIQNSSINIYENYFYSNKLRLKISITSNK